MYASTARPSPYTYRTYPTFFEFLIALKQNGKHIKNSNLQGFLIWFMGEIVFLYQFFFCLLLDCSIIKRSLSSLSQTRANWPAFLRFCVEQHLGNGTWFSFCGRNSEPRCGSLEFTVRFSRQRKL